MENVASRSAGRLTRGAADRGGRSRRWSLGVNRRCRWFEQRASGGSNGALREQATTGREACFRVESRHTWRSRGRRRRRRSSDRCVGGTKETTSNTTHRQRSGRYANSPRAGGQRDRAGAPVRGSPGHGVGADPGSSAPRAQRDPATCYASACVRTYGCARAASSFCRRSDRNRRPAAFKGSSSPSNASLEAMIL